MKRQKFKAAEEEEDQEHSDLLLALSLSSSLSSYSQPKPNSVPSRPLSLPLHSTWFPFSSSSLTDFPSSSSSSNPNSLQYSNPTQNLVYPVTSFTPPSSTNPLFSQSPQQLLTEPEPAPLLNRSSLSPNPSRRPGLLSLRIDASSAARLARHTMGAGYARSPYLNRNIPRNPKHAPRCATKSDTIPAPFPWATNRRAMVHSLKYLREKQINTITGMVKCKTCESSYEIGFDLEAKFSDVSSFIAKNKCNMYDRAPQKWKIPMLPICKNCGNSVRPFVSEKKRSINWLFLFLGQMLGCCTLEQLKYYCKHTGNFRTGAKDRILYLTYTVLCEQLQPSDPS